MEKGAAGTRTVRLVVEVAAESVLRRAGKGGGASRGRTVLGFCEQPRPVSLDALPGRLLDPKPEGQAVHQKVSDQADDQDRRVAEQRAQLDRARRPDLRERRGRLGLRSANAKQWGMMRLHTVGRRTGEERVAILGYFEDGPDLVTMAMNGWADPEPAWWLNLQAQPDVTVDLPGGSRAVHAHAADDDERPRLWARQAAYDRDLDAYAARRSRETAVVILSPRPG